MLEQYKDSVFTCLDSCEHLIESRDEDEFDYDFDFDEEYYDECMKEEIRDLEEYDYE
jgi:hypothetical protein